jgi:DNA-binding LacI/PurR family transcriptional regulator
MAKRLTMADIGRLAGVSPSTVSRAFSNSPSIPAATRARILKIAEEHNYRLDVGAQNLRMRRTKTVAAVFPFFGRSARMISDPFYLEIVGAIGDELARYDYDMILSRVSSNDDEWCQRFVLNNRVDGLLLIDRALHDRGINKLRKLGASFVAWGAVIPDQDYVTVGADSIEGGAMAVRHLAKLGRRRIGFIGGNEHMVETHLRRQGYERGLAEAGLTLDRSLIAFTDFTPQAAYIAVNNLLDIEPKLDGIFLCSDVMAITAMEVLRGRGRCVPADVSIIGYDDIPLAAYCSPRLTTLRQPIHEGGRLMVRKLFDLIEGKAVEPAMLPIELVVRDSCGGG